MIASLLFHARLYQLIHHGHVTADLLFVPKRREAAEYQLAYYCSRKLR